MRFDRFWLTLALFYPTRVGFFSRSLRDLFPAGVGGGQSTLGDNHISKQFLILFSPYRYMFLHVPVRLRTNLQHIFVVVNFIRIEVANVNICKVRHQSMNSLLLGTDKSNKTVRGEHFLSKNFAPFRL